MTNMTLVSYQVQEGLFVTTLGYYIATEKSREGIEALNIRYLPLILFSFAVHAECGAGPR